MCTRPKVSAEQDPEIIKQATQADASSQKASIATRAKNAGLASENVRTTNNGIEEDVISSKKKLLGE